MPAAGGRGVERVEQPPRHGVAFAGDPLAVDEQRVGGDSRKVVRRAESDCVALREVGIPSEVGRNAGRDDRSSSSEAEKENGICSQTRNP